VQLGFLAQGIDRLLDHFVHRMKMAAPDFLPHEPLGFWSEFDSHISNLASSGVRRKLGRFGGQILVAPEPLAGSNSANVAQASEWSQRPSKVPRLTSSVRAHGKRADAGVPELNSAARNDGMGLDRGASELARDLLGRPRTATCLKAATAIRQKRWNSSLAVGQRETSNQEVLYSIW
jgi:hypothetical protein